MIRHGDHHLELEVMLTFTFQPGTAEYIPSLDRPDLYDPGSGPELGDIELHWNGQSIKLEGSAYDAASKIIFDDYDFNED